MYVKKKKFDLGDDFSLRKLSSLHVRRSHPGRTFVAYSYNRDMPLHQCLTVLNKGQRGPFWGLGSLAPKFPNGRPIKAAIKRDSIARLSYAPPIHHEYFTRLKSEDRDLDQECLMEADLSQEEEW